MVGLSNYEIIQDMASFGHIAVGLVTAKHCRPYAPVFSKQYGQAVFWMSVLSMLPDADVITFGMDIPYEAPLGHRGAAHSILFAFIAGGLFAPLLKQYFEISIKRAYLLAFIAIVSHGFLDTLTDGGFGVGLLWPFSDERFFAPWRPIPVSPIGRAFLSARGLQVFATELLYCLPLVIYAFWPRKAQKQGS